ncbi:MAG TPA: polysaccharide lyase 8 family protein [Chitinivibrionales bacterium]|nr:polysaccharide lyase 8 family protein [Chitinivibrionales bacterium]
MSTRAKIFTCCRYPTLLILGIFLSAASISAQDLDTLTARLYASFQGSGGSAATIRQWLASLGPDGTWPDINYADSGRATWAPITHLSRMQTMAQAFRNPAHALHDSASVKNGFLLAFDAWVRLDPQSPNWWWNQIGTQLSLGPAMLLMKDQLSAAQVGSGNIIMARSWAVHSTMTGENLVWVSKITVWRGCIVDTASLVTAAVDAIVNEIRITVQSADNIQEDWSFHQHGPQLYSGGYGMGFSSDASDMAQLCRGTQFAFPQDRLDLLSHYILDGQQWMLRGTTMDHSACGREITRPNSPNKKSDFITICASMTLATAARSNEYAAFSARLSAWPAQPQTWLSGNRHFWCSDYMAHQRQGYVASVKMCSKRTRGAELVNSEGLKSYYLGDGVTFFYRTGLEYFNIFPIWDWTRLPGVTCRHDTMPPAMPGSYTGATDFVGGVSNGTFGAAALDYSRDGLTAKKSWFFFDKEIVALASGIAAASGKPVWTSVNQCFTKGQVTIGSAAGRSALGLGGRRIGADSWVHHDSVGYAILAPSDSLTIQNNLQTGSWLGINASESAAAITDTVFSLWFDHGTAPANASCAYVVIPGIGVDSLDAYVKNGVPCKVLANTTTLQAVRNESLAATGIVFYAAGGIKLSDSLTVSAGSPCAMFVRETKDSVEISVSNPVNAACTVLVSVNARLYGSGETWNAQTSTTAISFVLPGGLDAGKSVVTGFARYQTGAGSLLTRQSIRRVSVKTIHDGLIIDFGRRVDQAGHGRISIFDPSGRLIARIDQDIRSESIMIKPPEKAKGILFIRMECDGLEQAVTVPVVR